MGIICACMPALRLLLVRLFPALRSSSAAAYYANYGRANNSMAVVPHNTAAAAAAGSRGARPRGGIVCSRSFSVEYDGPLGDGDEARLVQVPMRDLERADAKGGGSLVSLY